MDCSDDQLLSAFVGGEHDALGALAERHERALLDLSLAILGSRDLALDAVQETWLRVVRHAGGFNGRSNVKTWLYRIAINRCRSMLASRSPVRETSPEEPADPAGDPVVRAAATDDAQQLKRAVERLSPPLRETILLCYTHGLTHAEAAEAMDVPIGTVKSRLNAGLTGLRAALTPGE